MVTSPIASKALIRVGESLTQSRKGSGRKHQGVDLFAQVGTPVLAPVDGRVLRVVNGGAGRLSQQKAGWFVDIVADGNGWIHRLLHLGSDVERWIHTGATIKAGQRVATVGGRDSSGIKHSRPHLHYEIASSDYDSGARDYGPRIDPVTVLPISDYLAARGIGAQAMDVDWKSILDKAIDIGGPILGKIVDAYAPGAGGVVSGGLQAVKTEVVDHYVPGGPQPSPPAKPQPAVAAADTTRKAAEAFLLSRGWTAAQVQEHLDGPKPPGPPAKEVGPAMSAAPTQPAYQAAIVDGALAHAGWTAEQRKALLQGPSAAAMLTDKKPQLAAAGPPPARDQGHTDHIVTINPNARKG